MTSGRSVSTPVKINFGTFVSFFKAMAIRMLGGTFNKAFKLPEDVKSIRCRVEFGSGFM